MARTGKPPAGPRQPTFTAAEWASLNEAFARAKAALGSHRLAERELPKHMQAGRLATAMHVVCAGADGFERLKPSFWKGLTLLAPHGLGADGLPASVQVRGLARVTAITRSTLWFFVARRDLDKLYPIAAAAEPETDRRKPGPRPKHDWPLAVAAELIRRAKAGEQDPTATKMIAVCETTLNYSPGPKEMKALLRRLL